MQQHDQSVLEKLGKFIRSARKLAKISQRELALRLHCSRAVISRIERGKIDLGLFELRRLFEACGFVYTLKLVDADQRESALLII